MFRLAPDTWTIRDGNFGGPLVLFNELGSEVLLFLRETKPLTNLKIMNLTLFALCKVIVMSPVAEFMVTNMRHRRNQDPGKDCDKIELRRCLILLILLRR